MIFEDKFNLLKNPSLLFYDPNDSNDVNTYLTKLIRNFRAAYNRLTLNLPIKQKDFEVLIDDELFDEYFNRVKELNVKRPDQSNFRRMFMINHLKSEEKKINNSPDFYLKFIYFRKVIVATNSDSYASLILSLLNLLSLWFGLKFLLIPIYLCEISQLMAAIYKSKIKRFFNRLF